MMHFKEGRAQIAPRRNLTFLCMESPSPSSPWPTNLIMRCLTGILLTWAISHLCQGNRHPKFLSILNRVRFTNSECQSSKPGRNGNCLSAGECSDAGGISGGSCASGFGTCCIFDIAQCGGIVRRNCSYIINPEFPAPHNPQGDCIYTIAQCQSGVCSIRLDFETFSLRGPPDPTEADGGTCSDDSFTVEVLRSRFLVPVICGENSGQHIYLDVAQNDAADSANLAFRFNGPGLRRWDIKVTQLECAHDSRPPPGCLQYLTSISGRMTTFNFAPDPGNSVHLANQQYSVCLARKPGYCCIEYEVCRDVVDGFSLHSNSLIKVALTDNQCVEDFIEITASSNVCQANPDLFSNRFCGRVFNALQGLTLASSVCDCSPPFSVDIFTDSGQSSPLNLNNRGLCLDYRYRKCA